MDSTIKPSLLNSFLIVYFYTLENELNKSKNGLETIKFQSEEANTDEFLKVFFYNFMLLHNDISKVQFKQLLIIIDSVEHNVEIEKLHSFKISKVFLPEHLNIEQKKFISGSKRSVYTSPDLYLEITDGINIYYETVELKSTKDNNIPGSSVQQVAPFEWIIFVKREKDEVSVATGFYINSITEKLPFPDRSPRPQIGYTTLVEWNKKYRKVENEILIFESISSINKDKIKILTDWQDYLTTEWLEIVKSEQKRDNEKWFNNAIRKFALKFITYSDKLSTIEKKKLKTTLQNLIN